MPQIAFADLTERDALHHGFLTRRGRRSCVYAGLCRRAPRYTSGMSFTDFVSTFWQDIAGNLLLVQVVLTVGTLLAVLHTKREPQSAIAWALTVLLVPFLGALLFLVFGYQTVQRRLRPCPTQQLCRLRRRNPSRPRSEQR